MSETSPQQEKIGDVSRGPGNRPYKGLMLGFLELLADGLEQIGGKVRDRKNEAETRPDTDKPETS